MTSPKRTIKYKGRTFHVEIHDAYAAAGFGTILDKKKILYKGRSEFQIAEIFESASFGRVMLLDNIIMLSTRDEFMYHEMMTHPALFTHPTPKNALVIGGGDGGTVREILRHKEVESITMCEIDPMVCELAMKFFPSVSSGLRNKKVKLLFQDGFEFIKQNPNKYDVIFVDSTDPIGPGKVLFTQTFYKYCFQALKKDGLMVAQVGSPFVYQHVFPSIKNQRKIFPKIFPFWMQQPVYADGFFLLSLMSKKYEPHKHFNLKRYQSSGIKFKYYNEEIHKAAFMLPEYCKKRLK